MTNEMINASDNALVNEELEMYNQRLGSFDNLEDAELSKEELEALLDMDADDIKEENATENEEEKTANFHVDIYANNNRKYHHFNVVAYNIVNNVLVLYLDTESTVAYPLFNIDSFWIEPIE
jgi:hypothetical protein